MKLARFHGPRHDVVAANIGPVDLEQELRAVVAVRDVQPDEPEEVIRTPHERARPGQGGFRAALIGPEGPDQQEAVGLRDEGFERRHVDALRLGFDCAVLFQVEDRRVAEGRVRDHGYQVVAQVVAADHQPVAIATE